MRGAILAAVIGAGGSAMGQAIPVDDPGFEETALTACSFTGAFGPSSAWRVPAGSGGAWRPGNCWDMQPPEGLQVAYSNGGTVVQTLATPAIAGATYTLRVMMGNRNHGCCSFTNTAMELWAGPTLIGRLGVSST